jgi:hypothetical protein
MVCAGPGMLPLLFVLNDHAPTWFTLALLGAFLVLLEQRAAALSGARKHGSGGHQLQALVAIHSVARQRQLLRPGDRLLDSAYARVRRDDYCRRSPRPTHRSRRTRARAFAARRRDPRVPGQSVRLAWCVFWTSLLVLLSTVFILSGIPEDLGSSRYLVGVIYAAAALVPLLGRRGPLTRAAVTAGATLYAFTGWLALAQHRIEPPPSPSDQLAGAVAKIASQERLSVGYAGYWDAAPITWATHLRVKVFPVDDCDGNQHLCAFELHVITSWVHAQAWSQDVPALRPRLSCCAVRADARSRQADRDSSDRVGHDVRVLVRHRHAPVRPLSGPGRRRPKSLLAPCCLSTQAALRRR